LHDLKLRSEDAYQAHVMTYTATTVLHRVFASAPEYDAEKAALVDTACALVTAYREATTRVAWHRAYAAWATAAGFEVPPDMREDSDTDAGRDSASDTES
jgi:hypothetical protein